MSIITFNYYNNPVTNTIMPITILLRTYHHPDFIDEGF